jgi:hypothetical protein
MFKRDLSVIYIINFARGLRVGVDAKGSGKVPFFPIGMENANNRPRGRFALINHTYYPITQPSKSTVP